MVALYGKFQISLILTETFPLKGDSGDLRYGPGNLLDKDVIFVSINYRLGVLGFLSLGNDLLPGNLGKYEGFIELDLVKPSQ